MSSVSSYEGSDKDSFFQRSYQENPALARHSYLRKTDFLDAIDNGRRDTDTWSVAATIDDQESVVSASQRQENPMDDIRDQMDEVRLQTSIEEEEDKQSRSNAAEFGDARSSITFDHSVRGHSDDDNDVVDDQISAPPQPQPSFVDTKSYEELLEENELLQAELARAQSSQRSQAEMIINLKSLTGCDEEVYGKALALSQMKEDFTTGPPVVVNSRTLTQKLVQLAETLSRFVPKDRDQDWRLGLEQTLYSHITQLYLTSLPFGTENQHLLNTAYADQISRFQTTLGANFAKWYRRQTVQSLALNPATKAYLQDIQRHFTEQVSRWLETDNMEGEMLTSWNYILDLCASLSLEIHGGDADVSVQLIEVGSKYDQDIMAPIGNMNNDKVVKMSISPLFIDEEEVVLLPARVVLE